MDVGIWTSVVSEVLVVDVPELDQVLSEDSGELLSLRVEPRKRNQLRPLVNYVIDVHVRQLGDSPGGESHVPYFSWEVMGHQLGGAIFPLLDLHHLVHESVVRVYLLARVHERGKALLDVLEPVVIGVHDLSPAGASEEGHIDPMGPAIAPLIEGLGKLFEDCHIFRLSD